jgi:hypothetical protein
MENRNDYKYSEHTLIGKVKTREENWKVRESERDG